MVQGLHELFKILKHHQPTNLDRLHQFLEIGKDQQPF